MTERICGAGIVQVSHITFHYTVGGTFTRTIQSPTSAASVNELTSAAKKATATSPRKRKWPASPRSGRMSPGRRTKSPTTSKSPVDLVAADDLESSTAMSEVSLVVEVTTPVAARRRCGPALSDVESDAVVPGGSPATAREDAVEMTEDLAECCDAEIASSVAAVDDDDVAESRDAVSNCQLGESGVSAEPSHHLTADGALSLFLDESLRDVMSMGFAEDGSGGAADRSWLPAGGLTTMDCLGCVSLDNRPLRQFGGETSEDASSDIDVELRRIVASVAHNNNNNDDVNSVTSDDCATPVDVARCASPVPLPAASVSLNAAAALPPSVTPSMSSVSDQVLAALDAESAASTESSACVVSTCPTYVYADCVSHVTVSSFDGCSDTIASASSTSSVVASTWSGTQSSGTEPSLSNVVSVSRSAASNTSTSSRSLTAATECDGHQEVTTPQEPTEQACSAEVHEASRSASCTATDRGNATDSGCCQRLPQSDSAATNSTESNRAAGTSDYTTSSSELGQRDGTVSGAQLRSDAVSCTGKTVDENCKDVTTPVTPATSVASSRKISCTSNTAETISSSGCSVQPDTARVSKHVNKTAASSGSVTSTTSVNSRGRSSKSVDISAAKDDLSVNCEKTSKSLPVGGSADETAGSSERASVATQTNTDLLGRYFHRRNKPVSSFLGGAKNSRGGSGGCGAAHLKERLSSRMMSRSATLNSSLSSASSAYHFGSTSSSAAATATTLPAAVTGNTVLLTSGQHVAPLIMPAIGPLSGVNGKTTYLITVPANFTLPVSIGAVIGPAGGGGGSVPASLGLPKTASVISGSQLVARTAGGGVSRLATTVSSTTSTATALIVGQSALGSPLQLLVAAATALTSSSSSGVSGLSRAVQSASSQPQQTTGVVSAVLSCGGTVLTPLSCAGQTSNSVVTTKICTSVTNRVVSSLGQEQNGSSACAGTSLSICTAASTLHTSTTQLQVNVRTSPGTLTTAVMLPMTSAASPGSGGLLRVATPSSSSAVSGSSLMTTLTAATVTRCSPSTAVSPTLCGARHATIASLPRVAMRRRSSPSDAIVQPTSTSSSLSGCPATAAVTLLNGHEHGRTPSAAVPAPPSTVRLDGGKSPVGGTTPTVVAKQPVHGEGAPASIIRAILERNLSCPLSYNMNEALTGQHVAPPMPSPTDGQGTLTGTAVHDGYYAAAHSSTSTIHRSSVVNQVNDDPCRAGADPPAVYQLGPSVAVHPQRDSELIEDCAPATLSERQNAVAKKRSVPSTYHHPISSKHRRFTTDVCTSADQMSTRIIDTEADLTHANSRYSGIRPTVNSSAYGLLLSVGTSGSQQTGSNSNGVLTAAATTAAAYENRQRQQNEAGSTLQSTGQSSTSSEPVQVEKVAAFTTAAAAALTRVALPKKIYAYLGSAGAARENAAAAAAASVAAKADGPPAQMVPGSAGVTCDPVALDNNAMATAAAGRRSAASDDGPIRHLRLMCSGLAAPASAGNIELRTHSTA